MRERLRIGDETLDVRASSAVDGTCRITLDGTECLASEIEYQSGWLSFTHAGQRYCFSALLRPDCVQLSDGTAYYSFARLEAGAAESESGGGAGSLTSQMPGTVLKPLVEPGTQVAKGTPLLILEAMKMEHEVCAPADGTVIAYPKPAGARVMPGDLLVEFIS